MPGKRERVSTARVSSHGSSHGSSHRHPLDTALGLAAGALVVAAALTTPAEREQAGSAPGGEPTASANDLEAIRTERGIRGALDRFQTRHRPTAFAVGVIRKFQDDRAGRLAALVSYYGFFSVFPALLALVTVLGFLLEHHSGLRDSIQSSALSQFPVIGKDLGEAVGTGLSGNVPALVIGVLGSMWAGMGAIQAAQDAMNGIWDVPRTEDPNFLVKRLRSLLTLSLIAVMFVANAVVPQLLSRVLAGALGMIALLVASLVVDSLVFIVAFKLLTVAEVAWRDMVPGAVVAAVGYVALQRLGVFYVQHVLQGATGTYGTFGIVLGLLSWMYLLTRWIVLAAEVDVVRVRGLWPRSLFPQGLTRGDQRSEAAQATETTLSRDMRVDVSFDAERDRQAAGADAASHSPGPASSERTSSAASGRAIR